MVLDGVELYSADTDFDVAGYDLTCSSATCEFDVALRRDSYPEVGASTGATTGVPVGFLPASFGAADQPGAPIDLDQVAMWG